MEPGKVTTAIKNGVGQITFFHPKSNSLPGKLLRQIAQQIDQFGQTSEVKVVVLQSEGEKAFCAGASFEELKAVTNFEQSREFFAGFAHVILAMRRNPKFVIARVQGKAVGGGVGVACAADYCLATDAASVRLSELALGFGPFIIGPAVERKIGVSAFSQLAIGADWRDALWAKEHGVYAELFPTISELDQAVDALAQKLSQYNPEAMAKLKGVLWQGTEHWEELVNGRVKITSELVLTPFVRAVIGQG